MTSDLVLVSLGANLPGRFGPPENAVAEALRALDARGLAVVAASQFWETAPVPVSDQPWFINAAAVLCADKTAAEIHKIIKDIERDFGRVSDQRNAPRVIDIDLLACGSQVLKTDTLQIPHPRLHERAFVLFPLNEVAPEWRHPLLDKSVDDMIADLLPGQEIRPMRRAA